MDRGFILHSEMGPGVAFAIFLTFRGGVHLPRRKVDLGGPLYTGGGRGHLLRRKVDRGGGGSILHSEKGPGVTFAIFLTF